MIGPVTGQHCANFIEHAPFHHRHQLRAGDDVHLVIACEGRKPAIGNTGIIPFQVIGSIIARTPVLIRNRRSRRHDYRYYITRAIDTELSRRFTVDNRVVGPGIPEIRRQGIPQPFAIAVPRVIQPQNGERQTAQSRSGSRRAIRFRPAVVVPVRTGQKPRTFLRVGAQVGIVHRIGQQGLLCLVQRETAAGAPVIKLSVPVQVRQQQPGRACDQRQHEGQQRRPSR